VLHFTPFPKGYPNLLLLQAKTGGLKFGIATLKETRQCSSLTVSEKTGRAHKVISHLQV